MKVMNDTYIYMLQRVMDKFGEWALENAMKIYSGKCIVVSFTRYRETDPPNYSLGDKRIPEKISCKYLGIIFIIIIGSTATGGP
jgi:hypothetical protein